MAVKLANNATSFLASSITTASTTITVQTADAAKFPELLTGEWFPVTVVDSSGNMEIMKATARAGVVITVTRAQEGTAAKAFGIGARVDLRLTKTAIQTLIDPLLTSEEKTLTAPQKTQARINIDAFQVPGGTSAQYVQGDGTIQAKSGLPVSTATQTALNTKQNNLGYTPVNRAGDLGMTGEYKIVGPLQVTPSRKEGDNTFVLRMGWNGGEHFWWGLDNSAKLSLWGYNWQGTYAGNPFSITNTGNVTIAGTLSKAAGTFDIDHPLDPFNKNLRHGFVESTEYLNIYRGAVDLVHGRMTVDIDAAFGMSDGTFKDLNEPSEVVVFLQTQYGPERVWIEAPIENGIFTIISENETSTASVGWMVTARRNDPYVRNIDPNCERGTGRFIPEYEKEEA